MTDHDKPGAKPAAGQSSPSSPQFTAAEVSLGGGRADETDPAEGGDVEQHGTRPRWVRALLLLIFGVVVGVSIAVLGPRYARPYLNELPVPLSQGAVTQGTVIDKHVEDQRLVLRVSSEEGVALAIFTQNLTDIDLLIEQGDWVELRAGRYQPFLHDPAIHRVRSVNDAGLSPSREQAAPPAAAVDDATTNEPVPRPEPYPAEEVRVEFERRMRAELAELETQITILKQQLTDAGTAMTEATRPYVDELDRQAARARSRLEEVSNATPAAWQDLRTGLEEAWDDLRAALIDARSNFEENTPAESDDEQRSPAIPPDVPQDEVR